MTICVFGASGNRLAPVYFEAARDCGRLLGRAGHDMVFGGGRNGLMGACARGAAEEGAAITGVAPRYFDEPGVLYEGCARLLLTETMAERKTAMENAADAFLVLPGGIGTLEEFFEVLVLRQLGRHGKPIVLLNTEGYYDDLAAMLDAMRAKGFVGEDVAPLFRLCATPEEALRRLTEQAEPEAAGRGIRNYCR